MKANIVKGPTRKELGACMFGRTRRSVSFVVEMEGSREQVEIRTSIREVQKDAWDADNRLASVLLKGSCRISPNAPPQRFEARYELVRHKDFPKYAGTCFIGE